MALVVARKKNQAIVLKFTPEIPVPDPYELALRVNHSRPISGGELNLLLDEIKRLRVPREAMLVIKGITGARKNETVRIAVEAPREIEIVRHADEGAIRGCEP